jgi:uncharacterized repeat protein (TIGR01451 family)
MRIGKVLRNLTVAFFVLGSPEMVATSWAQTVASSSAYGERVSLNLLPLLGQGVQVSSGPLPGIAGSSPPAYDRDANAASASVSLAGGGEILRTGVLNVEADAAGNSVSARSLVNGLELDLVPSLPLLRLLTLDAGTVRSSATIEGACGSLAATGSTQILQGDVGGVVAGGIALPENPAPNTVLLNLLGVRIILNEQIHSGDGVNERSLTVNAIHVQLQNSVLSGLGVLSGDIVIGHVEAHRACDAASADEADLGLSLTANPEPVTLGGSLLYTITVTNQGPAAAAGTVVTDTLPAGATLLSSSASQGSCSGGTTVTCSLGTLPAGGSATVTVQVRPNQEGSLVNTATAGSSVPDPDPADNSATVSSSVVGSVTGAVADLSLQMTDAPDPIGVGEILTYTLTVNNGGPSSTDAVITDVLPGGVSLVSAVSTQGSCVGGSTVTCSLGTIVEGSPVTVTLRVRPNSAGPLSNTANVSGSVVDPDPSDNVASASSTVNGPAPGAAADLEISMTDDPDPVAVGNLLTYAITVINHGPDAAPGVLLTDVLPAGARYVAISAVPGGCTGGGTLVCGLGSIPAGQQVTVTLGVEPLNPGTLTNRGTVSSAVPDPDAGDNSATVTTSVVASGQRRDAGICRIDVEPAATLLIPYFEVDLEDPLGVTTLFSINNVSPGVRLAQVTLWTDWAVPTLTFTIRLGGYDVETFNVRDLLKQGRLPVSSVGRPMDRLAASGTASLDCAAGATSQQKTVPAEIVSHLQAMHMGRASALTGACAASARGAQAPATGYVTVDVVNRCSALTPADSGYFGSGTAVASDDNVIWGDYYLVEPDQDAAHSEPAVHIVADPDQFGPGDYTFYARYVAGSGADHRQPLGTSYAVRFLTGGGFDRGTRLLVWRDTKSDDAAAVRCGQRPAWDRLRSDSILAFDEDESSTLIPASDTFAPWATQSLQVGGGGALPLAMPYGWLRLSLDHQATSLFGKEAQGWVVAIVGAEKRFTIAHRAVRLDSACSATP